MDWDAGSVEDRQVYPAEICGEPGGPDHSGNIFFLKVQLAHRGNGISLVIRFVSRIMLERRQGDARLLKVGINTIFNLLGESVGKMNVIGCLITQNKLVCLHVQ